MTTNEAFNAFLLGYSLVNLNTGDAYWVENTDQKMNIIKSVLDHEFYKRTGLTFGGITHADHRINTIITEMDITMFDGPQWAIGRPYNR